MDSSGTDKIVYRQRSASVKCIEYYFYGSGVVVARWSWSTKLTYVGLG